MSDYRGHIVLKPIRDFTNFIELPVWPTHLSSSTLTLPTVAVSPPGWNDHLAFFYDYSAAGTIVIWC